MAIVDRVKEEESEKQSKKLFHYFIISSFYGETIKENGARAEICLFTSILLFVYQFLLYSKLCAAIKGEYFNRSRADLYAVSCFYEKILQHL